MKKKLLRYAAGFIFLMVLIPGCGLIDDCGSCEYVLYLNGVEVERGTPLPFCGDQYQEKLDDPGRQVGDNWAIWECD